MTHAPPHPAPPHPDPSRPRDELVSLHGKASPAWDSLARLDPVFVDAYLKSMGRLVRRPVGWPSRARAAMDAEASE